MKTNYPLSQNTYTKNEINALKKVILSGNFTMGENCQKFESQFSKFFKSKNSIFVNSGSSANLLAISALSEFSKIEIYLRTHLLDRAKKYYENFYKIHNHNRQN